MAGHSKFKNIMHRKGAQDARRAKQFVKIVRELTVAVKEGSPDPNTNPRLRAAILSARQVNMPKDNVDRAIKKASGETGGANYESVRYEGYGPGGTAVIVEALTDNRNRTAPVVRAAFSKYGGALGETNSVLFMFDRRGVVAYPLEVATAEEILDAAIEAGADDVDTSERHEIYTSFEDFLSVKESLEKKFGEPVSAETEWNPKNLSVLNLEQAQTMMKLIDVLEEDDDVQSVYSNYDIPDDVAKQMEE